MTVLELDPRGLTPGMLVPPQSKSDAQRALMLADLLSWPELAANVDLSDTAAADVHVLAAGLTTIGSRSGHIDCQAGGTPFRFLLALAATTPGRFTFAGTERLGARPHQPLIDTLRDTLGSGGLRIQLGTPWPIEVVGGTASGASATFRIDARESSQFASALLLACARLNHTQQRPWSVELAGPLASPGYLDLTLGWLRRTGFAVETREARFTVTSAPRPQAAPTVPGDWSSLGYLLLMAWASGGRVARVDPTADHPDRRILSKLEAAGLRVESTPEGTYEVKGTARAGVEASAAECPDLIPTLAALACVLPARSRFFAVQILREKESDRLEAIRAFVRAAGGGTELEADTLVVTPPTHRVPRLDLHSGGDHRIAMSAAVLACLLQVPLRLGDPQCVAKSFPGFWNEVRKAGAIVSP